MLTLPSHYGKSVVFPCVRLRVVALATTRAIHIFNVELLWAISQHVEGIFRVACRSVAPGRVKFFCRTNGLRRRAARSDSAEAPLPPIHCDGVDSSKAGPQPPTAAKRSLSPPRSPTSARWAGRASSGWRPRAARSRPARPATAPRHRARAPPRYRPTGRWSRRCPYCAA